MELSATTLWQHSLRQARWGTTAALLFAHLISTAQGVAPVPVDFEIQARGNLRLRFESQVGSYYLVERSTDLKTWTRSGNPIYGTGRRRHFDADLENPTAEFFRVTSASSEDVWNMVWNDEFEENGAPNPENWDLMVGDGTNYGLPRGWGNKELQYYRNTSSNVTVSNGRLRLTARKESFGSYDYTSARIRTERKGDWTRGRFEIRAKLPSGRGLWPAIWMLPTDWRYGGWPASGEIDILEMQGAVENTIHTSLHYGGLPPKNVVRTRAFDLPELAVTRRFHVYALEWYRDEIRWFIDDQLLWTQSQWYSENTNGNRNAFPAPFNRRFHLLINLAVGGTFGGPPSSETRFPASIEVDYVRVYRQKT